MFCYPLYFQAEGGLVVLGLNHLQVAFYFMVLGNFLAGMVFLMEVACGHVALQAKKNRILKINR